MSDMAIFFLPNIGLALVSCVHLSLHPKLCNPIEQRLTGDNG